MSEKHYEAVEILAKCFQVGVDPLSAKQQQAYVEKQTDQQFSKEEWERIEKEAKEWAKEWTEIDREADFDALDYLQGHERDELDDLVPDEK